MASLSADEIRNLPPVVHDADFQGVATWSAVGLRWAGYRFPDVYVQLIRPRLETVGDWVEFQSLDGYHSNLPLCDALADNVLLADGLDGKPLTFEHGAPWRVVAPEHYGYKNVKHLRAIEFIPEFRPGPGPNEHPRARVKLEERGATGPGWLLRHPYSLLVRPVIATMAVRDGAVQPDVEEKT